MKWPWVRSGRDLPFFSCTPRSDRVQSGVVMKRQAFRKYTPVGWRIAALDKRQVALAKTLRVSQQTITGCWSRAPSPRWSKRAESTGCGIGRQEKSTQRRCTPRTGERASEGPLGPFSGATNAARGYRGALKTSQTEEPYRGHRHQPRSGSRSSVERRRNGKVLALAGGGADTPA